MSSAPQTTRSLATRLAAVWSDIHYGQQRLIAANRVSPSKARRSS